jgi:ATP-dependent DNA helicase DinG
MGYLVPALRWAAANGERTVVSTATIALQEQLVGKDLPFLAGALTDQKVRFALLKGWRNYLCLARLEVANAGGAALFEPGMRAELERSARGRTARATARWPTSPRRRAPRCGTRSPPSPTCARARAARTSTSASCSRRGARRPRRT